MFLSRQLLRLVSCVFVIVLQGVSLDQAPFKCPRRVDDGFFLRNYKPQPQPEQDIADKCVQINDCSAAKESKYRQYNGACNNLQFPMWGVTNAAVVRLLPAAFSDGISKPQKATNGSDLPSERKVRTTVLKDKIITNKKVSYLFSVFGQYISHDTARTSQASGSLDACCDGHKWPSHLPENCSSTRVPDDDEFYKNFGVTCLSRLRALTTSDLGCRLEPRQQIIQLTHFIDQSLIYGSSKEEAKQFKSGKNGQLKVSEINKRIFPKSNLNPEQACDIRQGDKKVCFDAGDFRVNQNPPLTTLVTIFIRCHNDIALKLTKLNPSMPEPQVFEETRRILIGIEHLIIRKEFLHLLIGPEFMAQAKMIYTNLGHDNNYKPLLNPSTLAEFVHGAYRGIHSTILDSLTIREHGNKSKSVVTNDWLNRPVFAVDNFDPILKSICTSPMAKQDQFGAFTMNNLFGRQTRNWGSDLEATSIARNREAGLPGYCDYMEKLLNEPKITSWEDLKRYFTEDTIENLKKVYRNFRDIDMYVGGVVECPVGNSMFGKLFTAIITDQFARWLLGDRHSITLKDGPGKFNLAQLREVNRINMAYLLCKYGDNLERVPARPFELPTRGRSYDDNSPESKSDSDNEISAADDQDDDSRTLEYFLLQEHQIEKPDIGKPPPILRSQTIECKSLPEIDLSPWKSEDNKKED